MAFYISNPFIKYFLSYFLKSNNWSCSPDLATNSDQRIFNNWKDFCIFTCKDWFRNFLKFCGEILWKMCKYLVCKFCLPLAAWSARHFRSGWYGFGIRFAQVSLAVLLLSPVGNILTEISMIFQICEYLWHFLFSLWQKSKLFVFVNRWQLSRAHS